MANTTSVLRGMLGAADRKILRRAGWVLAPATAIVVASLIGARLAPDTSTKKFLDNLHWTTSYGAAAMLAWFGVRSSATEEALARKCFAWALTFYVVGQVLWDIQVAVDWNPFPGPSDGGFLLLGPLSGAGLVLFLRRDTSPSQRRTAALDVAGLCAAVLALTLALYLPRRGEQALLQMGFLVAYPVVLSWAACVGLILALVLHLKPHLGWVLFLLALLVNGGLWLQWNSLTLDNALQDGTWYNALFSGTALAQGIGALLWRADVSTSRRWERFCEGFLRSLPLFGVVVSSAAVIFAYTIPGVPAAVKDSALVGGLVVVLLATVRQSLLLGESERLIQTERELRTSERKYRATLDLIPIPVCITTHPEGKLIELNLSFTQTFGVARERGLGKRPSDLGLWTDTKDRDRFVADMMASGQGQVQAFETTWKTPDGSLRPSLLTAALTDLNGALHCVFAIVDIGERKRAEAAIRQSEEKYRLLVEQAADGIFITDTRGTYVDVNSSGAEMMGMSRDEVIGHTIADLVAEDELERISAEISDLHAGLTVNREWRLKRKDGSVFWADVTAKMLPDGRLQGIVRDISDRKQGDEERRALEMQLSQSQKMQAVGSLAAGIAHDFNNILSAIRGNADLAAQDVGPDHPALESLQEIQKAGRRAANLVQQIVAFSRPRKPSSEIVSLPQIVDEVVRLLRSTLPAAVEMTTAYEKDAPAVQADPTQIHQVLVNLCTNASQAMEGHPGRIEIRLGRRTLPGPVALDLSPGEYACITVSDTGKGMALETRERIFEPFFTTKEIGQGSGLGLSVVHNIVKSHRGAIHVESREGLGTTFSVYLPAASVAATETEKPANLPVSRRKPGARVFYIDDDESLVYLVTRQLERRGHQVHGFVSPLEALATIKKDPFSFDVIVTDYNMPRMSGLKLMKEVLKLRSDAPFILTSGSINDEMAAAARQAGVKHLIGKPETDEELCDVISRILSR